MENNKRQINLDEILFNQNPIMKEPGVKEYFENLPEFVKESIMQSGVEIESESHLKQLVDHLIKEQKKK